jgi:tetrahydromethanopterin S-methyltransferase subunit G
MATQYKISVALGSEKDGRAIRERLEAGARKRGFTLGQYVRQAITEQLKRDGIKERSTR